MDKKILIELQKEISKTIELGNEGVLKGEQASELHKKIRNIELLKYFSNELLRAKYEKLINSIDTLYSDRKGYTGGGIFTKYKEIIDLELAQSKIKKKENNGIKQEFFKSGEEANITSLLKILFSETKESIIIYDRYFSVELLRILSELREGIDITVIYYKKEKDKKDLNKYFEAFNTLYNQKISSLSTNDNSIHDRYYIIDNKVFSLGSSIQKHINGTLFTPVIDSEGNKIIQEIKNTYLNKK